MTISTKLNSSTPQLNVNCSARFIKFETKVKYFGFKINNRLNFNDHINLVKTKISKSLRISGKTQILFTPHFFT